MGVRVCVGGWVRVGVCVCAVCVCVCVLCVCVCVAKSDLEGGLIYKA